MDLLFSKFDIMDKTHVVVSAFLIIIRRRALQLIFQRKRRISWVKDWIKNRETQGVFHQLMEEISLLDTSSYRNFVRIDRLSSEKV